MPHLTTTPPSSEPSSELPSEPQDRLKQRGRIRVVPDTDARITARTTASRKASTRTSTDTSASTDTSTHASTGTSARETDTNRRASRADAPGEQDGAEVGSHRQLVLTRASSIEMSPVYWTWADRIPAGMITVIPGREGIGKSLMLAWLTARITRGDLPGIHFGHPRAVIYAATEDSWGHTIAPRLVAAGADLDLVYKVDVHSPAGLDSLTLPLDCDALTVEITRLGVALLAADPLLSLISASIDTHRDRDLRQALEPLARLADTTNCAVVGLAHFNKSSSTDALNLITGSRAFSAVARAVLAIARDTDADDGSCVMSQAKSNLGRLDLPSLRYRIDPCEVATPKGPAFPGRLVFTGESERSVNDILGDSGEPGEDRATRDHASTWLLQYLESKGGEAAWTDIRKAATAEGLAVRTLQRARARAGVVNELSGYPARAVWRIDPGHTP